MIFAVTELKNHESRVLCNDTRTRRTLSIAPKNVTSTTGAQLLFVLIESRKGFTKKKASEAQRSIAMVMSCYRPTEDTRRDKMEVDPVSRMAMASSQLRDRMCQAAVLGKCDCERRLGRFRIRVKTRLKGKVGDSQC